MTIEVEKQFFDTFGIEPMEIPSREYDSDGEICSYYVEYPQITDRILLELENIIHREYNILIYEHFMLSVSVRAIPANDPELGCDSAYYAVVAEGENKKEALLKLATDCNVANVIKHQVQALFEENNNDR